MRKVGHCWFHPVVGSPDGQEVKVFTVQLWKNDYTRKWCAVIWQPAGRAKAEAYDKFDTRKEALAWAVEWIDANTQPLPTPNFKAIEKLGV